MRKFFAILGALLLAFAVVIGVGAKKQGLSLGDLDLSTIRQIVLDLRNSTGNDANPAKEKPVIQVVEPEENLSYDERMTKGDYFFDRGFLTFAVNEYVKAATLEPERTEPYLRLMTTHFALGDYEKAQRNTDTLLLLAPDQFEALYYSGLIHLKRGSHAEAQTILDDLSKTHPQDPQLDYARGLVKIAVSDYEAGKRAFQAALSHAPDAQLKEKIDRMLAAYQEFEFAKAAEPLYLAELLSRALNQNKEYELAIFKLKEVLRARSDLRDSWILLGFSYLNLGEHYFALTAFERAYELDSEWPATQYFLGLTHQELGNFDKAILYFNYALENQFEPAIIIKQKLAELYLEAKNYPAAANLYKEILQGSPNDIQAFVRPIWLYLDLLKQPEEALKLAELAAVTFPDSPMTFNLLGWAQTGTGDLSAAETNLKKALEKDPTLAAAYLNLGKLYEIKGLMAEAKDTYQKAYDLDPNGSIGRTAASRYNELLTK